MKAVVALIITISVALSPVYAAKYYKIVDENGKVTFSQVPPTPDDSANSKVESVSVSSGNDAMSRVTTEFGKAFCGDIQLPSQSYGGSANRYAQTLVNSKKRWQESLNRLNARMEKATKNKVAHKPYRHSNPKYKQQQDLRYEKQFQEDTKKIRDYRCAIDWVDSRENQINEFKAADGNEKDRLLKIAGTLERKLEKICGEQPKFDPTDSGNEYQRKKWYECSSDYRRDLSKVRAKLKRL